jgi:hypothetical protein
MVITGAVNDPSIYFQRNTEMLRLAQHDNLALFSNLIRVNFCSLLQIDGGIPVSQQSFYRTRLLAASRARAAPKSAWTFSY